MRFFENFAQRFFKNFEQKLLNVKFFDLQQLLNQNYKSIVENLLF